ncbi:RNA polymerase II C-terminal domain phosphatase-like 5 [Raphanus sativus]|uniref:RNA polymerase II C-terminal domain phosphatase-like n=1 Tax=Raphanus sativus TaxID=3726 RepID=A0A6J0JIE3_RAPSA|nr:RNA polymerase II C-terminal domain phosphatase-like 5 [Raphanus sativus]
MLLSVIQVQLYFLFLQLLFEIYLQTPYEKPRQKIRKLNPETTMNTNVLSSSSSSSPSHSNCGHWYVRNGTCLACKTKPSLVGSRQFDYLFSDLRLSQEAVSFTKRLTTLISLHTHKKLHLVLDLDHTLAHSVRVSNLSEAEKYLIIQGEKPGCLKLYDSRLIKVRPFVKAFLKEANKLFNMYVYTKGDLRYGQEIVKMIDPIKTYFGDRVITRRECPDKKTLDHVLADERGIVIVDDTVEVWPLHMRNLLKITRYFYFKHNGIGMSYAERKTDESRSNGALANLLKFLKEIHNEFFSCDVQEELDSKDVRLLIKGPFKPHGC